MSDQTETEVVALRRLLKEMTAEREERHWILSELCEWALMSWWISRLKKRYDEGNLKCRTES